MPFSSEHNLFQGDMSLHINSDDNEVSIETDNGNNISNRTFREDQIQPYENAYQPLDLSGTEEHVYNETSVFSGGNSSYNYLNTQIHNTHV